MSSKLESDVCRRLQVAPPGESYGGNRRPGRKQWQPTARYIWRHSLHVTCGLYTGISSGPMLGNKYGKTLPIYWCKTKILTKLSDTDLHSVRIIPLFDVIRCPQILPGDQSMKRLASFTETTRTHSSHC